MRKKHILNICMVLTIIVVAVCGIMAVGSVKGWFDKETDKATLMVKEKAGIAMIERSGVAYEVSEGTAVRNGDILYTKTASTLQMGNAEKSRISLDGNAEISLTEISEGLSFEVLKGDALVDARGITNVSAVSGDTQVTLDGAVASISTQAGSGMVYVYAGNVSLTRGEETAEATAGHTVTIVANEPMETADFTAASLSDTQMTKLIKAGMDTTFCFSQEDLEKVRSDREAEKLKAQQELLAKKEAEEKAKAEEAKKAEETENEEEETAEKTEGSASAGDISEETAPTEDTESTQEEPQEEVIAEPETEEEPQVPAFTCTIEIRCNTILDNMENLTAGKEGYVPESGIILGTSEVAFEEGETVFDVLQRVCDSTGIQLEYSWTPMYDSYYIEGINHLYEFDCGSESGWMYKVNGWFPNYGCSSYYLQQGDTIVWCYTCNGLGADVGGGNF